MDIGIVGVGRMGGGVASRLYDGGHRVVAYNRTQSALEGLPFERASSLADLVAKLPAPRVVWLYLPSGAVTKEHADELLGLLSEGDTLIDGGNSRYVDTLDLAARARARGIGFMDVGTSGGIVGREAGYCLMIGADEAAFAALEPAWQSVAQPGGYARVGAPGAGHYVKMIHNAIEYGMMQSYAEGMELLSAREHDLGIDLPSATQVWQHGSIISSFLGGLLADAVRDETHLESIGSSVADNGEGRWSILEALDQSIPVPVLSASLFARYASRTQGTLAQRTINVLRNKFGGHAHR